MGIATYNNHCRQIVMRYAQEWEVSRSDVEKDSVGVLFVIREGRRRSNGSMDRFPSRLQNDVSVVHGIRLVHLQRIVQQRIRLSRIQGDAVFDGLLYAVVELRSRTELQRHR